ncbi:MAG: metalloregulator ArsR/SmtB family transcription factor [Bacteroidales bacterium]|nr:metalloregulator ArsR/SmtB family transcription factor [Bacteroidales bacterium]
MSFTNLEPEQLVYASEMLKAMAHPLRIAILKELEKKQKMTVTEIFEALQIPQAVASHHLGILKNKGIVASKREGKNIYYFIRLQQLNQMLDCISRCACQS